MDSYESIGAIMKRLLITIMIITLMSFAVPMIYADNIPWRVIESGAAGHNPTAGAVCGPGKYMQFSTGSGRIDYCNGIVFASDSYAVTDSADPQWCFDDTDGGGQTADVCLKAVCTGASDCSFYVTEEIGTTMTDVLFLDSSLNGKLTQLHQTCKTIVDLTDDGFDGYEIFMASEPITIKGLACHCATACSSPLAALILEDRAGNDMTGSPTCSTTVDNSTYQDITEANSLDAGEGLAIYQSNSMGEQTNEYLLCWTWVVTP